MISYPVKEEENTSWSLFVILKVSSRAVHLSILIISTTGLLIAAENE